MNWGHKIVFAFVFFGIFIITLVVVCVREDFHLVSTDYYQEELDFQEKITQAQNVQTLENRPEFDYLAAKRKLQLSFPTDLSQSVVDGEVEFFRPSNAAHDFRAELALNEDGKQIVNINGRQRGLWMIKLSWKDSEKEYYMEEKIFL